MARNPFVFSFWIFILLSQIGYGQAKGHVFQEGIETKGKVKTIRESYFEVLVSEDTMMPGQKLVNEMYPDLAFEFSPNGSLIEEVEYGPEGELVFKKKISRNGNKTEFEITQNGQSTYRRIFLDSLNEQRKVVASTEVTEDGKPIHHEVFEFNGAGHTISIKRLDAEKKPTSNSVFILNESGREIESRVFDEENRLTEKIEFQYDSSGRVSRETRLTRAERILSDLLYFYDDHGVVIRMERPLPSGSVVLENFHNEYDSNGNLIRCIVSKKNGVPKYILERKISYFENP